MYLYRIQIKMITSPWSHILMLLLTQAYKKRNLQYHLVYSQVQVFYQHITSKCVIVLWEQATDSLDDDQHNNKPSPDTTKIAEENIYQQPKAIPTPSPHAQHINKPLVPPKAVSCYRQLLCTGQWVAKITTMVVQFLILIFNMQLQKCCSLVENIGGRKFW